MKGWIGFLFLLVTLVRCGDDDASTPKMTVKGSVVSSSGIVLRSATSGLSPSNWKIKIYKVGFSLNTDCTNMTVVAISENPDYSDWSASPTLATTDLADGTYNCVAFEMNTLIKSTPSTTSDNNLCVAGTEFTQEVGSSGESSTLLDGTSVTMDGTEDRVALYISTTGSSGDACGSGCGWTPGNPSALTTALVVSGTTSGAFTVDANEKLSENNGQCQMDEPTWGFQ